MKLAHNTKAMDSKGTLIIVLTMQLVNSDFGHWAMSERETDLVVVDIWSYFSFLFPKKKKREERNSH